MSAMPSAGALRAACNLHGRTDSLYMSERQCALVIHDAIQAETAALVALLEAALEDQHELEAEWRVYRDEIRCGYKKRYDELVQRIKANEQALAKHGKGAVS